MINGKTPIKRLTFAKIHKKAYPKLVIFQTCRKDKNYLLITHYKRVA